MSEHEVVLWRHDNGVGVLTLNRPERLNAWTAAMGREYHRCLDAAVADERIRAIVITGAGRGFCVGADFEMLEAIGSARRHDEPDDRPHSVLRTLPKPVIAAINGPCAGVGLVLATMCDLRFAARGAKLTTAFARRGLVAEYGLAWMLTRLVGAGAAFDLLLSARPILAPEAAELGLIDRVSDDGRVVDDAVAYARELASLSSPWSMASIKRQVVEAMDSDFTEASTLADELMVGSFARPDLAEGVKSFQERRPPRFPPLSIEQPRTTT